LRLTIRFDRAGMIYRQLNQTMVDSEKLLKLLNEEIEVADKPDATELVVTDGVVEFDNVRFAYDTRLEALKGISFKIPKGSSVALVGESGSGKSTILRLLYRFYEISSGTIK
jgi:ABC-type transport system involved in Fe-S cluster assembly fused permease/ATPase subunit